MKALPVINKMIQKAEYASNYFPSTEDRSRRLDDIKTILQGIKADILLQENSRYDAI